MRMFLGLLVIFALAVLSAAGLASASSNLANGTVLTYTNSGGFAFGGVLTCNSSTLQATMTNNPAGHGIHASITAASFTDCGSGNTFTATNLPWTLTTTGTSNPWTFQIDGFDLDVILGTTKCHFNGNPSGGNYDTTTERLQFAGSLTLQPGSDFACSILLPSPTLNAQYTVSPTLQLS